MKYVNAKKILPDDLILEIQKYTQGGYIYIPSQDQSRKKWGEKSGSRKYLKERNMIIRRMFKDGSSIKQLADEFYLSTASIKKIVYIKNI